MPKATITAAVCSLLLLGLSRGCFCLEISGNDYIEMPPLEIIYGIRDTGRIFELLNAIKLAPQSSPEDVLAQLRRHRAEAQLEGLDAANLDKLIGLAVDNEKECEFGQFEMFIKTLLMMKRTKVIDSAELFLAYLEHFGRRRFVGCAEKVKRQFATKLEREKEDVALIEGFFKHGFVLENEPPERANVLLLAELRRYKSSHTEEDMKKLVHEDLDKLPLVRPCTRFLQIFENDFNLLNLAKAFDPSADFVKGDLQLEKLNEIHRLCLEWQRDASKAATS